MEDNEEWCAHLGLSIASAGLESHVDLICQPPDLPRAVACGSCMKSYLSQFRSYIEAPAARVAAKMEHVDAVLIDGWFMADIILPDGSDQWQDWFTWQEEGMDWRRRRKKAKTRPAPLKADLLNDLTIAKSVIVKRNEHIEKLKNQIKGRRKRLA